MSPPDRLVEGGGGYVYRQHANGDVEIVSGPTGAGLRLAAGTPNNEAITAEIGPFPQVAASSPSDVLAEQQPGGGPAPQDQGWVEWAMQMGVSGAVEVASQGQQVKDEVSGRLSKALSSGYSRFFSTPGATQQAKNANANVDTDVAAGAAPDPEARQWQDGFDEAAAQAHIDAVIEGYMAVDAGGTSVATEYRNTSTRSSYHDPVFGGLTEAEMYTRHPEMYYALMGKASPAQLKVAYQQAIDAGVIHASVGKAHPDEPLTAAEIEEWNNDHFGVDCIGLVMNTLLTSEDFADFVPDKDKTSDFARVMAVNCRHFEAASQQVTDPDDWRALDVVTWTGGVGSGHVILIRDVEKASDGGYVLNCIESAGSSGPKRSTYTWTEQGKWGGHPPERATVRRASMPDTAPVADALEG